MENKNPTSFAFGKRNYRIMLVGLLVMAIGFIIMTLDTEPYGYGFLGLTLGPIVLVIGFLIQFFAILAKPHKTVK
ncbi:hypothetical protein TH63_05945 [Rufibacter radiotolerans]|uniref:DUF3098 domain-containing protein n=1 Tax=Rufibacter radiotolerans TaxID=1379910 RepID=A0A0H4VNG4_9BACT|nr:DUF3098 domain-containing protein [Rufibacter radiotolerans]AKQ45279.1 hypothetical protein TH63_05945 [Rufibacter radiotolerans]